MSVRELIVLGTCTRVPTRHLNHRRDITALRKAGLTVSALEEHREVPWNPLGDAMVPNHRLAVPGGVRRGLAEGYRVAAGAASLRGLWQAEQQARGAAMGGAGVGYIAHRCLSVLAQGSYSFGANAPVNVPTFLVVDLLSGVAEA